MRTLVIGGIEIAMRASHNLNQDYKPVLVTHKFRTGDGTLHKQSLFVNKLETVITGSGVRPSGLDSLDYTQPITIKCIAEREIQSASNVINVPSARRADYGVEGAAQVGIEWVSTPVTMAGDVATLDVVAGATAYRAVYWPELVCYCDPQTENRDARKSVYGWTLTGEQI